MGESAYNVTINNYDNETGEAAGQTAMRPADNKCDVFYIVIFFGNSIFYIIMSNNSTIDLLALGI